VHAWALERLKAIGPAFLEEFRQIMNSAAELKPRLEAAVKAAAAAATATEPPARGEEGGGGASRVVSQPSKPSIALKTDFSNFK